MKKYKHKKTGLIITEENLTKERSNLYSRFYLANESDFEEIKEYPKIVSFKHKTKTKNPILNIKEFKGEESEYVLFEGYSVFDTKDYVVSNYDIYQVVISENEVLTVGDKVTWNKYNPNKGEYVTIKNFHIDIIGELIFISERLYEYFITEFIEKGLRKAKTPVFATIDGVDIYEGDDFWYVTDDWDYYAETCSKEHETNMRKCRSIHGDLFFSTLKLASSYIYDNKLVFSRNQINEAFDSIINSSFGNVLVDRIKTKLGYVHD